MESTGTRSAVRDGLGVGIAVGLSGVAFGAAAVAAGLNVAQACALSLLAFTGASQFALIGVVAGGGNLVAGVLGAVLLGGRNALYGMRLADTLRVRGGRRLAAAHVVIDETTAVATAQDDPAAARAGFRVTGITLFAMWNLSTLLGAAGASGLGDPRTYGLDTVGPAAFLALLWPRLAAGRRQRLVALLAATLALATTPMLPPGAPVMVAAVAALAGAVRGGTGTRERGGEAAPPPSPGDRRDTREAASEGSDDRPDGHETAPAVDADRGAALRPARERPGGRAMPAGPRAATPCGDDTRPYRRPRATGRPRRAGR